MSKIIRFKNISLNFSSLWIAKASQSPSILGILTDVLDHFF